MSSKRSFRSGGARWHPRTALERELLDKAARVSLAGDRADHFEMAHMVHRGRSVQLNRDREVTARPGRPKTSATGCSTSPGPMTSRPGRQDPALERRPLDAGRPARRIRRRLPPAAGAVGRVPQPAGKPKKAPNEANSFSTQANEPQLVISKNLEQARRERSQSSGEAAGMSAAGKKEACQVDRREHGPSWRGREIGKKSAERSQFLFEANCSATRG